MNLNSQIQSCIQLCWKCRHECQETLYQYCLEKGEEHVEQAHVKLMTDCIQACQTAADFMTRGSALHAHECAACAEICEACAESCEAMEDERMKRCAVICRECAQSCREMGMLRKAA
ncbi:MAG: four-helix bundle copper-binding protein [Alphaproteobacteria bacterium]|nr:four-helix bundle copper-binding protein [Alphaproteobacteria bacterium]